MWAGSTANFVSAAGAIIKGYKRSWAGWYKGDDGDALRYSKKYCIYARTHAWTANGGRRRRETICVYTLYLLMLARAMWVCGFLVCGVLELLWAHVTQSGGGGCRGAK